MNKDLSDLLLRLEGRITSLERQLANTRAEVVGHHHAAGSVYYRPESMVDAMSLNEIIKALLDHLQIGFVRNTGISVINKKNNASTQAK